MLKIKNLIISVVFLFSTLSLFSSEGQVAKVKDIDIWYETFGEPTHPALLLNMGGLCQGILWPTEFCEQLASKEFFVIRYDYRDSGLSTCVDFAKNPYTLLDLAHDAIGLLDFLGVQKAHVCGLSMGGPVTELMAAHFPERVHTITLIATSCDLRPSSLAYDGIYPAGLTLSKPKDIYLEWMHRFLQQTPQTEQEQLEQRVACWAILNGCQVPFEELRYREIHQLFLTRLQHPESLSNHLLAIKNSFDLIQEVPKHISLPTLIFHGTEDPILPPDHGKALSEAIKGSKYILVQGMGHVLNCYFYDLIAEEIHQLAHCSRMSAS